MTQEKVNQVREEAKKRLAEIEIEIEKCKKSLDGDGVVVPDGGVVHRFYSTMAALSMAIKDVQKSSPAAPKAGKQKSTAAKKKAAKKSTTK